MHATIYRVHVADPIRQDEVAERLSEGILPVLGMAAGVAVYLVPLGDGSVMCFAVASDQAAAGNIADWIAAWVERTLGELVIETQPAEIGPVLAPPHLSGEPGVINDALE